MPNQLDPQPQTPAKFNIMELIRNMFTDPTPERQADESATMFRQMHGPTLSPPVDEAIPGFAPKRLTEDYGLKHFPVRPYYEQPGVGVAPSMTKPAGGEYEPHVAAQYEPETKQTKRTQRSQ
jgi:hypothetical protein